MAEKKQYIVDMPDGRKYGFKHVNHDLSEAEVAEIVRDNAGMYPVFSPEFQRIYETQREAHSGVQGAMAQAGHSAMMGTSDEVNAGLGTLISGPEGSFTDAVFGDGSDYYDMRLLINRRVQDEYKEANPKTALAAEIGGGILGVLGTGGAGAAIRAPALAKTGTMLPRMASRSMPNVMARGGIGGAAYGFGEGEGGFEERVDNAVLPAVVGTVAAPAMNLVTRTGQEVWHRLPGKDRLTRAQRQIMDAMRRDKTPKTILDGDFGNKDPYLMDLAGPATQRKVAAATRMSGENSPAAQKRIADRQAGQSARIQEDIMTDASGDPRIMRNMWSGGKEIDDELSAQSKRAYEELYAANPDLNDAAVLKMLDDDIMRDVYEDAMVLYRNDLDDAKYLGQPFEELKPIFGRDRATGEINIVRSPDFRTLDYMKRGLQAKIDKITREEGFEFAKRYITRRDALTDAVDKATEKLPLGGYGAARGAWREKHTTEDVIKEGRKFWDADIGEVEFIMSSLPKEMQDTYRASAASSVLRKVNNAKRGVNIASMLDDAPNMRQKMRILFVDDEARDRFLRNIALESDMAVSHGMANKGSHTAQLASEMADITEDGLAENFGIGMRLIRGDIKGAGVDLAHRGLRAIDKKRILGNRTASEIADLGASSVKNPDQEKIIRALLERAEIDRAMSGTARSFGSPIATRMLPL